MKCSAQEQNVGDIYSFQSKFWGRHDYANSIDPHLNLKAKLEIRTHKPRNQHKETSETDKNDKPLKIERNNLDKRTSNLPQKKKKKKKKKQLRI